MFLIRIVGFPLVPDPWHTLDRVEIKIRKALVSKALRVNENDASVAFVADLRTSELKIPSGNRLIRYTDVMFVTLEHFPHEIWCGPKHYQAMLGRLQRCLLPYLKQSGMCRIEIRVSGVSRAEGGVLVSHFDPLDTRDTKVKAAQ